MDKITAPGIYDIDMDTYHSDCCAGPSFSSGDLRALATDAAAKWFEYSWLNPKRRVKETTPAMEFGKAYHAAIVGHPGLDTVAVVSPFDDFRTKDARAWKEDALASGRVVLKPSDMEKLIEMKAAFDADPKTGRCFKAEGAYEMSYVYKDAATGLWVKTRPDHVPFEGASFIDELKSTVSLREAKLAMQGDQLGYHIQAAALLTAFEEVTGDTRLGVAFAVQEKDPPYLTTYLMMPPEAIEEGRRELRRALDLAARCIERGHWPGYYEDVGYFPLSYRLQKQIEFTHATTLTPQEDPDHQTTEEIEGNVLAAG